MHFKRDLLAQGQTFYDSLIFGEKLPNKEQREFAAQFLLIHNKRGCAICLQRKLRLMQKLAVAMCIRLKSQKFFKALFFVYVMILLFVSPEDDTKLVQ